jgi:hypothetical protein
MKGLLLRSYRAICMLIVPSLPQRWSHPPGESDVSTLEPGKAFLARANFDRMRKCGRPCWLPVYAEPRNIKGQAATLGWPCEAYRRHLRYRGRHCFTWGQPKDGDWFLVIGQVRGQQLRDQRGFSSDIWNVVVIPRAYVKPEAISQLRQSPDGTGYLAYVCDLWTGNTGWHDIPFTA